LLFLNITTKLPKINNKERILYVTKKFVSKLLFILMIAFSWIVFTTYTQMLGGSLSTPTTQCLKTRTTTITMLYPSHRLLSTHFCLFKVPLLSTFMFLFIFLFLFFILYIIIMIL
jgi:hypothetical protein